MDCEQFWNTYTRSTNQRRGRSTLLIENGPPASERPRQWTVDVLDRVLDKGLVVAGDVKISLAEVELLTIRIRLIVCSIDKAQQIGLDWWKYDAHLSPNRLSSETKELRRQVRLLERKVASLSSRKGKQGA